MQQETLGDWVAMRVVRCGSGEQRGGAGVLDASGVWPTQAGKAVEQRGGAGATRAKNGDALSLLHLEAGASQHPDARRATGDAGGIALPQGAGAHHDWHAHTVREAGVEPATATVQAQ